MDNYQKQPLMLFLKKNKFIFKGNIISKKKFVFDEFLPPEIVTLWPLISRFHMIFRPWFFFLFLMKLAIDSYSCFWKCLTSVLDPMGDLAQNRPHKFDTLGTYFELRWVPRNCVFCRRVISIEKPSWTLFPFWTWLCDQLLGKLIFLWSLFSDG